LASKRNSIFVPVSLIIAKEERAKRIVQPDRASRFKITDVKEAYLPQETIKLKHKHLLKLDVTHLPVDEAVSKIIAHIQSLV
jgi:hypothetical protein